MSCWLLSLWVWDWLNIWDWLNCSVNNFLFNKLSFILIGTLICTRLLSNISSFLFLLIFLFFLFFSITCRYRTTLMINLLSTLFWFSVVIPFNFTIVLNIYFFLGIYFHDFWAINIIVLGWTCVVLLISICVSLYFWVAICPFLLFFVLSLLLNKTTILPTIIILFSISWTTLFLFPVALLVVPLSILPFSISLLTVEIQGSFDYFINPYLHFLSNKKL